ncbi:MAG: hypothetical protein WA786_09695 [Acidimicrobiales bacterium]
MSSRLDRSWSVRTSYQTFEADRCVDLFLRPDGTFGFEEFRRDPEDMGVWTPVGGFCRREYVSETQALEAALEKVPWLQSTLEG